MNAAPPSTLPPLRLGIVGYGEVGHGLAVGLGQAGLTGIVAYQRNADRPLIQQRARESGVRLVDSPAQLAEQADLIIAVTQGAQSIAAATAIGPALGPRHLYADLAAATPGIKQTAGAAIMTNGARFADGAIEGSPLEHGHSLPIIVSGPGAADCAAWLNAWGTRLTVVGPNIGTATAIKGLRSVMMKGFIGLLVECAVAARQYGIQDEVFASIAEWFDALPFMANANRLLRTTTVHAERRAEEAAMSASIVTEAGIEPIMIGAGVDLLQRIAALGLRDELGGVLPPDAKAAVALLARYAGKA